MVFGVLRTYDCNIFLRHPHPRVPKFYKQAAIFGVCAYGVVVVVVVVVVAFVFTL